MAAGVSHALEAIDWSAPWLEPFSHVGPQVAQQVQGGEPVHRALQAATLPGPVVRFVPQSELPGGTAYEQYIFDTGRVPPAKTCTISSTAWCGCSFRTPSAA